MKKLFILTLVGMVLNIPGLSRAEQQLHQVNIKPESYELSGEVRGRGVEENHISFYLEQKRGSDVEDSYTTQADLDELSVFGVQISSL